MLIINILFSSCFIIILLTITYKKCNTYNNKQRVPNVSYLKLVQESYNNVPDLNIMLRYLNEIYRTSSLDSFYILDSIRLLSKSFRSQNFSKGLSKFYGDITMFYDQMFIYRNEIIKNDKLNKINNICEIGFQVGAGCLTFLTSLNHSLKYYGFDYGLEYSKCSYSIISKYFDMNITWGKSEDTIPKYQLILCNIIHIDGDHQQISIYNDIRNMKRFANKYSVVFIDDVYYTSESIINAINNKILTYIKCFSWKPFCIGKYYN